MHIPQKQPVCVHCYYLHLEPRPTQLSITLINLFAGFPPPSGMQQPGGYPIPPQHLYSRGGGHWPLCNPSLLPHRGSTHHSFTSVDQPMKYIRIYPPQNYNVYIMGTVLLLQNIGHFSWYIFTCRKATSYLYHSLTSSHSYSISYPVC